MYDPPPLETLLQEQQTAIEARLPGADAMPRLSVLGALARVFSGGLWGVYAYLAREAREMLPVTASITGLRRHGAVWGVPERSAAFATGLVTFNGASGALIPEGTRLRRDGGIDYVTDAPIEIVAGVATTYAVASTAGAAGNLTEGAALALVSPVEGVAGAVTVGTGGLAGGSDPETAAEYRARILARIQSPPAGGSAADYTAWASAVPGVTRVWVAATGGSGVAVRVMMDVLHPRARPDAAALAPVVAAVEARRPVTAEVSVTAPNLRLVNFTVAIRPDTPAIRAAVAANLAAAIDRDTAPGQTLLISRLRHAVSSAAGVEDYRLNVPAADTPLAGDEIALAGEATWAPWT